MARNVALHWLDRYIRHLLGLKRWHRDTSVLEMQDVMLTAPGGITLHLSQAAQDNGFSFVSVDGDSEAETINSSVGTGFIPVYSRTVLTYRNEWNSGRRPV